MNIDPGYSSNIALTFDASRVANELGEALNCGEDSYKVLHIRPAVFDFT